MADGLKYENSIVVVMPVRDFAKGVEWYRDVLGLDVFQRNDDIPWADMATAVPGFHIGISQNPGDAGVSGEAVTLGVADIATARAELESRGVQFTGPTDGIPGIVLIAPFVDLDGNPLLLAQNFMPR